MNPKIESFLSINIPNTSFLNQRDFIKEEPILDPGMFSGHEMDFQQDFNLNMSE